jgi:cyanate permease
VIAGFFLLGCGWGGMIPLTEVIWASFFGRRHLGAVRSAALPFSLLLGAAAPLAVSYYHDIVGDYSGALVAVAIANIVSAGLILRIPRPA